jgi:hypothetical protein
MFRSPRTRTPSTPGVPRLRWGALALAALLPIVAVPVGLAGVAQAAPTVPSAPTGVSAVANGCGPVLTWTVGADGGDAISNFVVTPYIGATAQQAIIVEAGAVGTHLDPTPGALDNVDIGDNGGFTYTYTIESQNAIGTSTESAPTNAVLLNCVPDPLTDVNAVATASEITLQWTVGANNGLPISSFAITTTSISPIYSQTTMSVLVGSVGSTLDPTPGAHDSMVIPALVGYQYLYSVGSANADGTTQLENTGPYQLQVPSLQSANGSSISFDDTLVGDISEDESIVLTNNGAVAAPVSGYVFGGADPDDFLVDTTNCQSVAVNADCTIDVAFVPGAVGTRTATLTIEEGTFTPVTVSLSGTGTEGYMMVTSTGAIYGYGDAPYFGGANTDHLTKPIVAIQSTGDDGGYWMVASDGGIFSFGDAQFYGSTGAIHLNKPIVGMAVTPDDGGYWMVASDGGIFSFGDAQFYGSTGAIHLNKPIVGMAATPDGGGYWLVASDGGIFSFGDAQFYGSTGAIHLNQPIVGMAATPDGAGYWMVASDGGIFSFGDAQFHGSTGAIHLNKPIVGMAATPDGNGYWLTASDGGVFNFGDAPFDGSAGALGLANVVGIAGTAP